MTKIAVLDDWQDVARDHADWAPLRARAEVDFIADPIGDEDAMAARLADYDILLTVQDRTALPGSLIRRLAMIGVTIGNARLDLAACADRGIVVSHTDGPAGDGAWAPAELALGLIIAAYRGIPAADRAVRAGAFQHGVPVGRTLAGRTLGILGLGRLGSRLARYAAALDLRVIAWNPGLDAAKADERGATAVTRERLFAEADIVSIHAALSPASRGLVGADDLARMRDGALLVNTSRGPIVEEAALLRELAAGRIGAALDVFDDEPLPAGHPPTTFDHVVLTPHLGFGVEESWATFYPQSVENALAFLDGHPIRVVTPADA